MTLKWSDELDEAFMTAKEALAQATMLVHPHADKPTALTVDVSGTAVGAVLEQNSDGSDWKPERFSAENFGLQNRTTVRSIVNS